MAGGGSIWSERDTTPAAVDAALRDLLRERHAASEANVAARVLNLVVIADRDLKGEIQNRLDRVGRYHASRTILCVVEKDRTTIDALATISGEDDLPLGELAVWHEQVVLSIGPRHLKHLDRVVDPLVVTDLATLVWSPHEHPVAVDSLLGLAQIVLLDSVSEPDPGSALSRAKQLSERAYLVDLAWLRSTPWRERIAASFDPPSAREELGRISSVAVRHHPDSAIVGLFFLGWLGDRLGWAPGPVGADDGGLRGAAQAADGAVELRLDPDSTMSAPGLAGITVETRSGLAMSLDRGPGGLAAWRRSAGGREARWTVLGASRGESGILGEGIRQALLRDKTYWPAVRVADRMVA